MSPFLRSFRLGLAAVALAAVVTACAAPETAKEPFPHAVITPEPRKDVPAVTLQAAGGKPFTLEDARGKWVWLYFGFANCPDVCPAAMDDLAAEYKALERPEEVEVVFVSVDPARDTPDQLAKYVTYYHPDFQGVTGERAAIDALVKPLGIGYVIDKPAKPGDPYPVSHSNLITVLDPEGRYAATYVPGAEPGKLAEDFNQLAP
ncbi:MAG: SCO family protein [Candidatus Sericytochromatia bacterium]